MIFSFSVYNLQLYILFIRHNTHFVENIKLLEMTKNQYKNSGTTMEDYKTGIGLTTFNLSNVLFGTGIVGEWKYSLYVIIIF